MLLPCASMASVLWGSEFSGCTLSTMLLPCASIASVVWGSEFSGCASVCSSIYKIYKSGLVVIFTS